MTSVFDLGAILFFLFIIYTANQVEINVWREGVLRLLLFNLLGLLFLLGIFSIQYALIPPDALSTEFPSMTPTAAAVSFAVAVVGALLGYAVLSLAPARDLIMRLSSAFNPSSHVHITAVVLCIVLVFGTLLSYLIGGGQSGLAEAIETTGVSPEQPIFQAVVFVLAGFLGIGFAIRRGTAEAFSRLGLRLPLREDITAGIAVGLALYFGSVIFSNVWQMFVSLEEFQQQTQAAEQFAQVLLAQLPLAIVVSLSAAVGEEILIRGALQPIFGVWLSSAFFTLLHAQYLATPTMLLIFGIAVGFGWVRQRCSTTAAIIAHFVYNTIPFLLFFLGLQGGST